MKKLLLILLLLNTAHAINITRIDFDDSLFNSEAFHERVDSTTAVIPKADSGSFNFNPLFLSGGFYRDELTVVVRAHTGTAYMVIDNEYDPGGATDIWLSSDGEGGRDGGHIEMFSFDLPDSVALSAGSATTVTKNYIYITYDDDAGGSPALKRHAEQDQIGVRGDLLDSMIFIGSAGLGAVSGDNVTVRYFDVDQPSLYKGPLRTTLHGHHAEYHSGLEITAEAASHTFSHLRGFVHSGTDNNLIPSFSTESGALRVSVYADSNYASWDSLDNFIEYSDGVTIGNARYFWVVIWGAISMDTTQYQLYMNIQTSVEAYLNVGQAEQYKTLPTSIPEAFHESGFLIAGLVIRKSNNEIQTLSDGSTFLDLRGFVSGTKGGGGAPPTDSAQVDAWNFILPPEIGDSLEGYVINSGNDTINGIFTATGAVVTLAASAGIDDDGNNDPNYLYFHGEAASLVYVHINTSFYFSTTLNMLGAEIADVAHPTHDSNAVNRGYMMKRMELEIEDSLAEVWAAVDKTDPHYLFTLYNPNSFWIADSVIIGVDNRSAAAITITRIDVSCLVDPDTELDFDLLYADALIGQANKVIIDEMNTTNGVATITSGFDEDEIPANKCVYIRFNAEPDADMTQVNVRVTYTID